MGKILKLPISNKHLWEKHQWYCDADDNIIPIIKKKKYEIFVCYDENFEFNRTEHSNRLNYEKEGVEIAWNNNPFELVWYRDNYIIHL